MQKYISGMEDIGVRQPVNKLASIVTGKGVHFESNKKILTMESDFPFPVIQNLKGESLIGIKRGRLIVIGLLDCKNNISKNVNNQKWVTKCICGKYVIRRGKAILNKKNTQDRCEMCRELVFLKRNEIWRRTGQDYEVNRF